MNTNTNSNGNGIGQGSIVKYQGGYYRTGTRFSSKAQGVRFNLGSIFGKHTYHRQVPVDQLTEAHAEWYQLWSESETYRCM